MVDDSRLSLFSEAAQAIEIGNADSALSIARRLVSDHPYHPLTLSLLRAAARLPSSDPSLEERIDLEIEESCPGFIDVRFRIGSYQLARGDFDGAKRWYDRALSSVSGLEDTRMLPFGNYNHGRVKHDLAQLNWLCDRGALSHNEFAEERHQLELLVEATAPAVSESEPMLETHKIRTEEFLSLLKVYRRCLHLDSSIPPDDMLNIRCISEGIERYTKSKQASEQIVVVDNFFSDAGILYLNNYLLNSHIWHNDAQKSGCYVGCYQTNGIRTPFLNSCIEVVEGIIRNNGMNFDLEQIWAYRNVVGTRAVGLHADFSCLNVNIWLTPDVYNNDPSTGGLNIYPILTPDEWKFETYNDDGPKLQKLIENTRPIGIPYRFNRAVIFNSAFPHSSQPSSFEDCYQGWRTNLTLLFGDRGVISKQDER
jgi:hypothetical protein